MLNLGSSCFVREKEPWEFVRLVGYCERGREKMKESKGEGKLERDL